jgi:hypothetical protein
MTTPLTFSGALTFPADPGGSPVPIAIAFAGQYDEIIAETLKFSGSGSKTIDLTPLNGGAGATILLIKMDAQVAGTPPVFVKVNSETVGEELQPGGFKVTGNPAPAAGITSVTIVYTGVATIRLWALG